MTLVDMVLGAFSERRLAQGRGEGDKAKLGADALSSMRHVGCGLGLQRCLLKLAHVRKPFPQDVLDLLEEHSLELRQVAGFHRMLCSRMTGP